MRIETIRFKNLNSLSGEWTIDLGHPAYVSDGIFAITGPTGAGKSTLLDAVCLALYGRTPRLSRVGKSGNEAMSRQTGECFAEVTFTTQAGRFRCHWSQHRARRRSDGELQAPKHEIAHADSGEIVASQLRGVAEQIEAATGMDFERFTRSMLLAQGGFAAFLQAAADERAPILEQITGTAIYSEISIRVHERRREENAQLERLQAETAGIPILDPEQEAEIHQALDGRQQDEERTAAEQELNQAAVTWLKTLQEHQKALLALGDEEAGLKREMEAFAPERRRLAQAEKAATLDADYATLAALRKQQADDLSARERERAAWPLLDATRQECAEALASAESRTSEAKRERLAAAPLIQEVRSLDQRLRDQKATVRDQEQACQREAALLEQDRRELSAQGEKRQRAEQALQRVDSYLAEHRQDEWLLGNLAGVEEQVNGLVAKSGELAAQRAERIRLALALDQALVQQAEQEALAAQLGETLASARARLQQGEEALAQVLGEKRLREYRTEKESLLREQAYLARIAQLEEHRAKLEAGKPCPLCGATEHPFAWGEVPRPDETELRIEGLARLIARAETQEADNRQWEVEVNRARDQLAEADRAVSTATNARQGAEAALAELDRVLESLQGDLSQRREAIGARLRPLGLSPGSKSDPASWLDDLRKRLEAWRAQTQARAETDKELAAIDAEMQRLNAVAEIHRKALEEKRQGLEALRQAVAATLEKRQTLFGDRQAEAEERRLEQSLTQAEAMEKGAGEAHLRALQAANAVKAQVEALDKAIGQRQPALEAAEARFARAISPVGFADEADFLKARLAANERADLAARDKDLDARHTALRARQTDRQARLDEERARQVTDQPLEVLEARLKEGDRRLRELHEIIAGLRHRLNENAEARRRLAEKQVAIEAQQRECRRWENLHQLIGSADGKKYRNFAQGLTFEMMIAHANRQLQKMTDRYLLVPDHRETLELSVLDNYQAGEVRSTKNLSGGESFIVSLCLALGLSSMASRNVRVDSLFLDEGFGTLDEEALDVALETLSGLRQEGKLIGVISHVSALKERIGTQIQVKPLTGGRSRLEGPGCRSV